MKPLKPLWLLRLIAIVQQRSIVELANEDIAAQDARQRAKEIEHLHRLWDLYARTRNLADTYGLHESLFGTQAKDLAFEDFVKGWYQKQYDDIISLYREEQEELNRNGPET
jgi:hypothetical protein